MHLRALARPYWQNLPAHHLVQYSPSTGSMQRKIGSDGDVMISKSFITIAAGASFVLFGLVWTVIERLRIRNPKTPIEPLSIRSVINLQASSSCLRPSLLRGLDSCLGQSAVEFTLVFLLFLVIAWIPADFGLAFYTGQLALNASRDGARIAAADRNVTGGSCTLGSTCSSAAAGSALRATANRLSSALLPGATVTVAFPFSGAAATCDQTVSVQVQGSYSFFFYQLLNVMGISVDTTNNISRQTVMRWEHQC